MKKTLNKIFKFTKNITSSALNPLFAVFNLKIYNKHKRITHHKGPIPTPNSRNKSAFESLKLSRKTVLLRVDFNVPIKNRKVTNNFRIKQSLPTIKKLLSQNCKLIIISHLGRPKGKFDPKLSLRPVAKELHKLLPNKTIHFLKDCIGKDVKQTIDQTDHGQIILLENLRFYKEEKGNDLSFAHSLANLADFYIFDAFAVAHRKHSSTSLLPLFIPSATGLLVQKEINALNSAMSTSKKSLWIIGGAKLDKIDVISSAIKHAQHVYVAGALAFSFLKAKGIHIGHSKSSRQSIDAAKKILTNYNSKKITFPIDVVCSNRVSSKSKHLTIPITQIPSSAIGLDIGEKSTKQLFKLIDQSQQIIFNGPLGYIEIPAYRKATSNFLKYLSKSSADTLVGGGETLEIIAELNLQKKFSHLSTGGGATLAYLSKKQFPALDAISRSQKKYKTSYKIYNGK